MTRSPPRLPADAPVYRVARPAAGQSAGSEQATAGVRRTGAQAGLPSGPERLPPALRQTATPPRVPVASGEDLDGFFGRRQPDAAAPSSDASVAARGAPRRSRHDLHLPARPTTPEISGQVLASISTDGHKRTAWNNRVTPSVEHRLQLDPVRSALQAQGIDLTAGGGAANEQPRNSTLTALLEEPEREAHRLLQGLTDEDMEPAHKAAFMASIIRQKLQEVEAVNKEGTPLTTEASGPLNAGQSQHLEVPRKLAQPAGTSKISAARESGAMSAMAAHYAIAVFQVPAEKAAFVSRVVAYPAAREFQLKLQKLSDLHGPSAVALVHKMFDPAWMLEKSGAASHHRGALVDALLHLPQDHEVMKRLVNAAKSPEVMASECATIETTMASYFKSHEKNGFLHHALERLKGNDYEPVDTGGRSIILNRSDPRDPPAPGGGAYADAPPADTALQWLRSLHPLSDRL
jgi:hypothetical protein